MCLKTFPKNIRPTTFFSHYAKWLISETTGESKSKWPKPVNVCKSGGQQTNFTERIGNFRAQTGTENFFFENIARNSTRFTFTFIYFTNLKKAMFTFYNC